MIIIVETTFIIEIVVQQAETVACEEILRLTDTTQPAHLVLPAFSIAEAGMMLERKRGERRDFINVDLARHTRDLRGSAILERYAHAVSDLKSELLHAENAEDYRYSISPRIKLTQRRRLISPRGSLMRR